MPRAGLWMRTGSCSSVGLSSGIGSSSDPDSSLDASSSLDAGSSLDASSASGAGSSVAAVQSNSRLGSSGESTSMGTASSSSPDGGSTNGESSEAPPPPSAVKGKWYILDILDASQEPGFLAISDAMSGLIYDRDELVDRQRSYVEMLVDQQTAQVEDTMVKAWCRSWKHIEQVLVAFLACYGIRMSFRRRRKSRHSYQSNVILTFMSWKNPLGRCLINNWETWDRINELRLMRAEYDNPDRRNAERNNIHPPLVYEAWYEDVLDFLLHVITCCVDETQKLSSPLGQDKREARRQETSARVAASRSRTVNLTLASSLSSMQAELEILKLRIADFEKNTAALKTEYRDLEIRKAEEAESMVAAKLEAVKDTLIVISLLVLILGLLAS